MYSCKSAERSAATSQVCQSNSDPSEHAFHLNLNRNHIVFTWPSSSYACILQQQLRCVFFFFVLLCFVWRHDRIFHRAHKSGTQALRALYGQIHARTRWDKFHSKVLYPLDDLKPHSRSPILAHVLGILFCVFCFESTTTRVCSLSWLRSAAHKSSSLCLCLKCVCTSGLIYHSLAAHMPVPQAM